MTADLPINPEAEAKTLASGREALRNTIDIHYRFGVINHGDLRLHREAYDAQFRSVVSRFAGVSADNAETVRFASNLHGSDLYLSISCAEGSDPAWRRFHQLYFRTLSEQFLGLTRGGRDVAAEQADTLVSDLYLPDSSGRPRIGSYDGRSSLATWLHVIVNHRWINERQKRRNELPLLSDASEMDSRDAMAHVERHVLRERYTEPAVRALEQACLCLTPEERQLLLWRYDNELKLGEIAGRLTLHQSNVTRQITKVCGKIQALVMATLIHRQRLSAEAVDECLSFARGEIADVTSIIEGLRKLHY